MSQSPSPSQCLPASADPPTATAGEIAQQPRMWRAVADAGTSETTRFLADLRHRPGLRVVLTGAGSSAFAGEIAAPALRRHLRVRVDAVPTTDIVARPLDHLEPGTPTLLVSFARSGNSPESLASTRLADELVRDVRHLVLTCDRDGALGRAHSGRPDSLVRFMPDETNDAGFAMTSSLTSMLLSCLLMLGPLTPADAHVLADAAEGLLARRADIAALARAKRQRFVFLGAGALQGLARESALKLLELTAGEVVTYSDSPLGFRHGPKAVLDADTMVVVFGSADPYTRRYDLDIIAELRAQLGQDAVTVLGATALPAELGPTLVLDGPAGLDGVDDAALALPYLVFAQNLALHTSLELGKTPDNPFPAGEVSRVVRGVTIHPMAH